MGSAVDPTMNVYGISMFHQLHCLKALRRQLWEFEKGLVDGSAVLRGGGAAQAHQRQQHFGTLHLVSPMASSPSPEITLLTQLEIAEWI